MVVNERAWRERSGPALAEVLVDSLLHGLANSPPGFPRRTPPDSESTLGTLTALSDPGEDLLSALHFVLLAGRVREVRTLLQATIGEVLETWLKPLPRRWTPREAGQAAYLIALGLGLGLASRHPVRPMPGLREELTRRVAALSSRTPGRSLPEVHEPHWDRVTFGASETSRELLLEAAYETFVTEGFESIRLTRLSRAVGVSQALARSWYPTDRDLILDTLQRSHEVGLAANEAAQHRIIAGFGPAIAEAVMIREYMRPGREVQRAGALELVRMCWEDPDFLALSRAELTALSERMQHQGAGGPAFAHIEWAMGLGVIALAVVSPMSWQLPYDVVTIPLLEPVRVPA